jgi:hypothetical protein
MSSPRRPYLDAVVAHAFRGTGRFHVPGHKGGPGADPGLRKAIGVDALADVAHAAGVPLVLTVDVDVLDPAFVPGTRTPQPGGMTAVDLLLAVRTVAGRRRHGRGHPDHVGTNDYSALVAERVVREALTCVAMRRRGISGDRSGRGS